MDPLGIAQRYFEEWNQRDSSAVRDTLEEDGTHPDPTTGGPLSGEALIS